MQGGKEKFLAIERSTSKLWQSDGSTTKGLPDSRNNGTSVALTNGTICATSLRIGVLCIVGQRIEHETESRLSSQKIATRISMATSADSVLEPTVIPSVRYSVPISHILIAIAPCM